MIQYQQRERERRERGREEGERGEGMIKEGKGGGRWEREGTEKDQR